MKVEDRILSTYEYKYNSDEISKGMCLTTVSEGDLQVVREALLSVPISERERQRVQHVRQVERTAV